MTPLKKKIIENGIHYTLHGDYYFPDLEFPKTPQQGIGRYGRMRKTYLEKHRPGLYERLILSGKLYEHLAEIDTCCADRMVNRTPSRGQRKNIKFSWPAAIRCWPLFMRRGKACAFPSASGRLDCAGHVLCCNSEYTAGSSEQARAC